MRFSSRRKRYPRGPAGQVKWTHKPLWKQHSAPSRWTVTTRTTKAQVIEIRTAPYPYHSIFNIWNPALNPIYGNRLQLNDKSHSGPWSFPALWSLSRSNEIIFISNSLNFLSLAVTFIPHQESWGLSVFLLRLFPFQFFIEIKAFYLQKYAYHIHN